MLLDCMTAERLAATHVVLILLLGDEPTGSIYAHKAFEGVPEAERAATLQSMLDTPTRWHDEHARADLLDFASEIERSAEPSAEAVTRLRSRLTSRITSRMFADAGLVSGSKKRKRISSPVSRSQILPNPSEATLCRSPMKSQQGVLSQTVLPSTEYRHVSSDSTIVDEEQGSAPTEPADGLHSSNQRAADDRAQHHVASSNRAATNPIQIASFEGQQGPAAFPDRQGEGVALAVHYPGRSQAPSGRSQLPIPQVLLSPPGPHERINPYWNGPHSDRISFDLLKLQRLVAARQHLQTTQKLSDMAVEAKTMILQQGEYYTEQLRVYESLRLRDHDAGRWTQTLEICNHKLLELVLRYAQEANVLRAAAEECYRSMYERLQHVEPTDINQLNADTSQPALVPPRVPFPSAMSQPLGMSRDGEPTQYFAESSGRMNDRLLAVRQEAHHPPNINALFRVIDGELRPISRT